MRLSLCLCTAVVASSAVASNQRPLYSSSEDIGKDELMQRLKDSLIVPSIVDEFYPSVKLELSWKNASSEYGNTVDPDDLQKQPHISLHDWREHDAEALKKHKKKEHDPEFVVALTDPDAPSFEDPKWSQVCHWIIANVPLSSKKHDVSAEKAHSVVDYKPPGPPPKTGYHRYIAVVLVARNGTTSKLHLSVPSDRKHWGYDGYRTGVREWAHDNGLAVVGANYILAQNHKQ